MRVGQRSADSAARFLALREAADRAREQRDARARELCEINIALRSEHRRLLADAARRLRARWLTRADSAATNAP